MEQRAELTQEEMSAVLAHRVHVLYGMTVEEYKAARANGTLPDHPGSTALEVFSGEAGSSKLTKEGAQPRGGRNGQMRQRNGSTVRRAVSSGLRKLRHLRGVHESDSAHDAVR